MKTSEAVHPLSFNIIKRKRVDGFKMLFVFPLSQDAAIPPVHVTADSSHPHQKTGSVPEKLPSIDRSIDRVLSLHHAHCTLFRSFLFTSPLLSSDHCNLRHTLRHLSYSLSTPS